jgi:integrase
MVAVDEQTVRFGRRSMRVRLKGINHVRKQLADGRWVDYWYPWKGKGAPRLPGKPGSPEFVAAYNEAVKIRVIQHTDVLGFIIDQYTSSKYFGTLKPRTIKKKTRIFKNIKRDFGDLPLSTLKDPAIFNVLEEWHCKIAERSHSEADYHWWQLSAMLTWAVTKRLINSNPLPPLENPYSGSRIDKIWTELHVTTFLEKAPEHLHLPFWIALWTGQREGDIVSLRWSAYDGRYLRVLQEKRKRGQKPRLVVIPVLGPLKQILDSAAKRAGMVGLDTGQRYEKHVVLTSRGRPYARSESFSDIFSLARDAAGIVDRTFHDLRRTAVTEMFIAGCTVGEIATITGHSLNTVQRILDKHYFHRDLALAESAMRKRVKLETKGGKTRGRGGRIPNWIPNQEGGVLKL